MRQPKQIAFAFPRGAHQESFIDGVLRFAEEANRDWSYLTPPESLTLSVFQLKGWDGDGVLAAINTPDEAEAAAKLGVPTVNISSALESTGLPSSLVDNRAIGRIAGEHLLGKGLRSFAYYGLETVQYSVDRRLGFEETLQAKGLTCVGFLHQPTFGLEHSTWVRQQEALEKWLVTLERPCGLLAVSDYRARLALDACRRAGLAVPKEVAVIGVDNERIICEHASPSLTSVARNDELEGYRAAELLDRLMRGETGVLDSPPTAPLSVVERASTAAFAVSDHRLKLALEYLHSHLGDPITIDELTEHADVSRRWLEYAFREAFRETPYQYLRRQRLLLAKRILSEEASVKVYEVARRTGFNSSKQFAAAFQQEFEVSPSDWVQTLRNDDRAE